VLPAIVFDHETRRVAGEISNETTDRRLAAKFESGDLTESKP
jgi:hypothetical protein